MNPPLHKKWPNIGNRYSLLDTSDDKDSRFNHALKNIVNEIAIIECEEEQGKDNETCPVVTDSCNYLQQLDDKISRIEHRIEKVHDQNKNLLKLIQTNQDEIVLLQKLVRELVVNKEQKTDDILVILPAENESDDVIEKNEESIKKQDTNLALELCNAKTPKWVTKRSKKEKNKNSIRTESPDSTRWSMSPTQKIYDNTDMTDSTLVKLKDTVEQSVSPMSSHPEQNSKIVPNNQSRETQMDAPKVDISSSCVDHVDPEVATTSLPCNKHTEQPKLVLFGGSMVKYTGKHITSNLPDINTCVCSTSGLRLDAASRQIGKVVEGHTSVDTIILQIGTCDVEHSDHYELVAKYGRVLDEIRKSSPECRIVISAVPYRTHPENGRINAVIDSLNGALRIISSSYYNCAFQDFNPCATEEYYSADGVHFNPKGKKQFAELLVNYMKNFQVVLTQPNA